jgi:hypothetical protein
MSDIQLAGLLFQEKLYSQVSFSECEHKKGFKLLVTCKDLDSAIENKNVWVKDIEEI